MEGVRTVEELVRSPLRIHGALVAPQLADAPRGAALLADLRRRGVEIAEVNAQEFASAAETDSPQGVLAIAGVPPHELESLSLPIRARIVILDAVQDPGNVGTIVRTSAALGASAVLAMPGTVDLWNAKVVRSAMGAGFHLPVLPSTWDDLDAFRRRESFALWGADARGTALHELKPPERLALVVGNEGAGARSALAVAAPRVAIPLAPGAESLNVAIAAGIFLYGATRG